MALIIAWFPNCESSIVAYFERAPGPEPIDTIKAVFIEGPPIYPTAGFYEKTHTQIVVCNPECIRGVFRVAKDHLR